MKTLAFLLVLAAIVAILVLVLRSAPARRARREALALHRREIAEVEALMGPGHLSDYEVYRDFGYDHAKSMACLRASRAETGCRTHPDLPTIKRRPAASLAGSTIRERRLSDDRRDHGTLAGSTVFDDDLMIGSFHIPATTPAPDSHRHVDSPSVDSGSSWSSGGSFGGSSDSYSSGGSFGGSSDSYSSGSSDSGSSSSSSSSSSD